MSHFYSPWKRQKTIGFLTFSGGIEMWHWTKMGLKNSMNGYDALSRTSWFYCFLEIVKVTTLVFGNSCEIIFYQFSYILTRNFNNIHYRLGKTVYLTSKHSESLIKTKMDVSVFLSCFIFILTYSKQQVIQSGLASDSIWFFILYHYFETGRIDLLYFNPLKHDILQVLSFKVWIIHGFYS